MHTPTCSPIALGQKSQLCSVSQMSKPCF
uniref:Uncharacterized protein n=1 Tax=Anguilla anguilla TaxID=7936 RepID=A0A0E9U9Y5_ANGAN